MHLLRSEHVDKTRLKPHMAQENRARIGFAYVVSKNPKTPKLSSMADDAITWGGIGGLGSLVYICAWSSVINEAPRIELRESQVAPE